MTAPAFQSPEPPPRRLRFCSHERPQCIDGHRLRGMHRLTSDGIFTCGHRYPRSGRVSGPVCGKLCWAAVLSYGASAQVPGSGERIWVIVELMPEDVRWFTDTPMTLLERLDHLQYAVPEVMRHLLRAAEPSAEPEP